MVDEHTVINPPESPYAITKLREELFLEECSGNGLPVIILRFGTIFGVSRGMQFHTAVNKFCWQVATTRSVTVWSSALHQTRPYLHVSDAAGAINHAIMLGSEAARKVNVVGVNATVVEVLQSIQAIAGRFEIKVEEHPAMGTNSYSIDGKLAKSCGFQISRSLEDGIRETMLLLNGGKD
jgi:nucleoside-diphosphate-sugar epimerase